MSSYTKLHNHKSHYVRVDDLSGEVQRPLH